jgi:hypothetical protein
MLVEIKIFGSHGGEYEDGSVSSVVVLCSLVEVYQRFRGPCCLHHQGDEFTVNFFQTTQHYNPEDSHLRTYCRENLKSYRRLYVVMDKDKEMRVK